MSGRTAFIWNPRGHTVARKGAVLKTAASHISDCIAIELDDFSSIPAHMKRLAQDDVRLILIEGGDGTVSAILSECLSGRPGFKRLPTFGLLPGGMTNLAAKVIGLNKTRFRRLAKYLKQGSGDEVPLATLKQRLLTVSTDETVSPRAGFFLSTGAIPDAIDYCRRDIHGAGAKGSFAVGLTLMKLVLNPASKDADGNRIIEPRYLTARTDTIMLEGIHLLALATTLPEFNLGLKPFWGEGAGAIRFTYSEEQLEMRLRAAARILTRRTGPDMERHGLRSFNTDSLTLSYDGALVLDGEYLPSPETRYYVIGATEEVVFLK